MLSILVNFDEYKRCNDTSKMLSRIQEQEETMHSKRTHQMEDRIVSIQQPYVRHIVCSKAMTKTEFGAKINISLMYVYARVDHFDWDAFKEGIIFKHRLNTSES